MSTCRIKTQLNRANQQYKQTPDTFKESETTITIRKVNITISHLINMQVFVNCLLYNVHF